MTDSPKTADEAMASKIASYLNSCQHKESGFYIVSNSDLAFVGDMMTEALTQARRAGRREGLEEALEAGSETKIAKIAHGEDIADQCLNKRTAFCQGAYYVRKAIRTLIDSEDT